MVSALLPFLGGKGAVGGVFLLMSLTVKLGWQVGISKRWWGNDDLK